MNKENIGIEYTMKSLKNSSYALIDNETGNVLCTGTEKQICELFIEQNEREVVRISKRTVSEVKNILKADVIFDSGDEVFRKVAIGKCYYAILKMTKQGKIKKEQGIEIMKDLELYAFNAKTPLTSEEGREYYSKFKNNNIL